MYRTHPKATQKEINGITVNIPPAGYVYNIGLSNKTMLYLGSVITLIFMAIIMS